MNIDAIIAQNKTQIESVTSMQELIFNLEQDNYEDSVTSLTNSNDFSLKSTLRHFLATIGVAFQTKPMNSDLLIELLCSFSNNINNLFTPHEIYNVLCLNSSNYFLLQLITHNILTFNSINSIPHIEDNSFLVYFAPEIKENDPGKFNELVKPLLTIDIEEIQQLRSKGVNDSEISAIIRNDDIESFINYLSRSSSINQKIPTSIYEKSSYLNKEPTYFEYSAFYGSIKIFKYLMTNKISPSQNLTFYAVAGGNYEIIHLCEQLMCDFSNGVNAAILFHQNDILNYLKNQGSSLLHNSIVYSILGYNFEYFYQLFNENFDKNQEICERETFILYTMKHMYSEFGIAFTSLQGIDYNRTDNIFFFNFNFVFEKKIFFMTFLIFF